MDGSGGWLHVGAAWNSNNSFSTSDPRVLKWAAEPDPWLHGYWGYDWADSYVPLAGVSQVPPTLISHNLRLKSFCESQFPHKSFDPCFTMIHINDKMTDLCGN